MENIEMKREDLAALFAPKVKTPKKKKEKKQSERTYFFTNWSEALLRTAILLRYGTLTLPAKPIMSYTKVAAKVGKSPMALWRRIKKYEETGEFMLKRKWGKGSTRDLALEKQLCDERLL